MSSTLSAIATHAGPPAEFVPAGWMFSNVAASVGKGVDGGDGREGGAGAFTAAGALDVTGGAGAGDESPGAVEACRLATTVAEREEDGEGEEVADALAVGDTNPAGVAAATGAFVASLDAQPAAASTDTSPTVPNMARLILPTRLPDEAPAAVSADIRPAVPSAMRLVLPTRLLGEDLAAVSADLRLTVPSAARLVAPTRLLDAHPVAASSNMSAAVPSAMRLVMSTRLVDEDPVAASADVRLSVPSVARLVVSGRLLDGDPAVVGTGMRPVVPSVMRLVALVWVLGGRSAVMSADEGSTVSDAVRLVMFIGSSSPGPVGRAWRPSDKSTGFSGADQRCRSVLSNRLLSSACPIRALLAWIRSRLGLDREQFPCDTRSFAS